MTIVFEFLNYILEQRNEILTLLIQHIRLTVFSVLLAIVLGVPLGILVKYVQKLNKPILGFANIVQAIPSMALLGIAIPLLGIGSAPAIAMVILYSLLPIIKNTYSTNRIFPRARILFLVLRFKKTASFLSEKPLKK